MKIGIFYGSTTQNTANAALAIKVELDSLGEVDLHDIARSDLSLMADYDLVILGSSTWGAGELQEDWHGKETLPGVDLKGKKAAVFGTGDQRAFGDTFVDALGALADGAEKAGAKLIGLWPDEGYSYSQSASLRDSYFVGLPLDDDNEPEMTDIRIKQWVEQLQSEVDA